MFIAHTGDSHITARAGETGMTLEEQVELLQWIGTDAYEHGAEMLMHGGDLFDQLSSPDERLAAIRVVTAWARLMPVVIVRGNHDRLRDLAYLAAIRSDNPVHVIETPKAVVVRGATVACLPWPRKAELVEALGSVDPLEVQAVAGDAMRAVLRGFSVELQRTTGPRILLAHAELGAAVMDNGQPIAGRCDIELGETDLLGVGADYVALGHIHLHQVIGGQLCYAGSPRPTAFPAYTGSPRSHGYCLVDVRRGQAPEITHRRTPYRELVTIEASWDTDVGALQGEVGLPLVQVSVSAIAGASVRLKYAVTDGHRAAAAEMADQARRAWMDAGAHAVKIDAQTVPTYRLRSTKIQQAQTTADRLRAYWDERGNAPAAADATRLLTKLGELEETAA
jgi:DNA repair exonuclease SbcCD nuclease subunit